MKTQKDNAARIAKNAFTGVPGTWEQMQKDNAARIANNEAAIKTAIRKMGFRRDTKFVAQECYNRGSLRIAFFSDDERCELYTFTGVPGHSSLAYEISLMFAAPAEVVIATIAAAVKADEE
jgi:hypothetical protein